MDEQTIESVIASEGLCRDSPLCTLNVDVLGIVENMSIHVWAGQREAQALLDARVGVLSEHQDLVDASTLDTEAEALATALG